MPNPRPRPASARSAATRVTDAPAAKAVVVALDRRDAPPPPRERLEWDPDVPGLALRSRPSGARSWVVVRKVDGRTVKRTLGSADALTRAQARALASAPMEAAAHAPTLAAFCETFLDDCAGRWKPGTRDANADSVRSHIARSALGPMRIDVIDAGDVAGWLAAMTLAEGTRNRALAVLSGAMRHAELLGHRRAGSNPCKGLRRRRSDFTAHYLSAEEYARLGAALRAMETRRPIEVAALRFIALTGARRGEALALEWSTVDGGRAVLPDSKTGPRTIWLGAAARGVLAGLPQTASPRVFPGRRADREPALDAAWREVRAAMELPTLRVHDLRHAFASVAVTSGEPLRTVSGLLGHTELTTTEGYAHLAREPIAAAAQRVGDHLAQALAASTTPAIPAGRRGRRATAAPLAPALGQAPTVEPAPAPAMHTQPLSSPAATAPVSPAAKAAAQTGTPIRERDDTKPAAMELPPLWSDIPVFLRMTIALPAFCRARGIDEDAFHAALIAWRAVHGRKVREARR